MTGENRRAISLTERHRRPKLWVPLRRAEAKGVVMDGEETPPGGDPQPAGQDPQRSPAEEAASTAVAPPPPIDVSADAGPIVVPPPPGMSLLKRILIAAGAFVVVGGIAAIAIAFIALRGTGDVIDRMVPANSTAYVTFYLDPALKQKLNLRDLIKRFPDLARSDELERRINQVLDQALNGSGLTAKDIRPWLGTQVAVTVQFDGERALVAVLVASKDDALATAALAKIRTGPEQGQDTWKEENHGGVVVSVASRNGEPDGAYAIVDHIVLVGDQAAINDVIDTSQGKSPSIQDSDKFAQAIASLPTERLALAYVDFGPLIGELQRASEQQGTDLSGISSSLGQLDAFTALGATLSAQPNGIALDLGVGFDPSKLTATQRQVMAEAPRQNPVLSFTPKDAYGVVAATGFGQTLQAAIDQFKKDDPAGFAQLDAQVGLSAMLGDLSGDFGLEVSPGTQGSQPPAGALLLGTSDESGMRTFLDHVATLVTEELEKTNPRAPAVRFLHQTYRGVDLTYLSGSDLNAFGVTPVYAVTEETVIVASSLEEIEAIIDAKEDGANVTSAPNLVAATTEGELANNGMIYVDLEAVIRDARKTVAPDDLARFDAFGGSNLGPLKALVMTGRNSLNRTTVRMFLLIR
jgi:hypothetical protein